MLNASNLILAWDTVYTWDDYIIVVVIPLLVVAIGVEIWQQSGRPFRFSLRTLLVTATVVAIAFGLIAYVNQRPQTLDVDEFPARINGSNAEPKVPSGLNR